MLKRILITTVVLGVTVGAALAQPSEYILWRNNASGKTMCDPESPGKDWVKVSGPYEDPNCSILLPQ
jgi:hypothetical protein